MLLFEVVKFVFVLLICVCISDVIVVKYANLKNGTLFILPLTIKLLASDVDVVAIVYGISVVLVWIAVKSAAVALLLNCVCASDVKFEI